jgi:hypothetical protein
MGTTAQKRALQNYRDGLRKRGLARFEVMGLDVDRPLIRSLAKHLADDGPQAAEIRKAIGQSIAAGTPKKGAILSALRRSPLVGADLDLRRVHVEARNVKL